MVVIMTPLLIQDGIRLSLADSAQECVALQQFIRAQAQLSYQCEPPPSHGPIIGAWKDEAIVGSVALCFRGSEEPFPLEDLYEDTAFRTLFPEGFNRTLIAEAGRWFSALRGSPVSSLLLRAMRQYVLAQGKHMVIGEAKAYAIQIFRTLNYKCVWLPQYEPRIETVPSEGRRYYTTLPAPHLFRMDL